MFWFPLHHSMSIQTGQTSALRLYQVGPCTGVYIDRLTQRRRNSIGNALELRLFFIKPLISSFVFVLSEWVWFYTCTYVWFLGSLAWESMYPYKCMTGFGVCIVLVLAFILIMRVYVASTAWVPLHPITIYVADVSVSCYWEVGISCIYDNYQLVTILSKRNSWNFDCAVIHKR